MPKVKRKMKHIKNDFSFGIRNTLSFINNTYDFQQVWTILEKILIEHYF
jgi:hypothetical protein